MTTKILGLALVFLALGSPAFGGVILSTGPDDGQGNSVGYLHTGSSSQPFDLLTDSILTSMTISTWMVGLQGSSSVLTWTFSTGAFGDGTVEASGSSTASDTYNFPVGGYSVYNTTASLPSVDLTAGHYWLTLTSNDPTSSQWVYWGDSAGASFGGGQTWISTLPTNVGKDFVLELDGNPTSPEPGTMGLMGLGVAGVFALLRRRSSKA